VTAARDGRSAYRVLASRVGRRRELDELRGDVMPVVAGPAKHDDIGQELVAESLVRAVMNVELPASVAQLAAPAGALMREAP
jgi:hypothetical protein